MGANFYTHLEKKLSQMKPDIVSWEKVYNLGAKP